MSKPLWQPLNQWVRVLAVISLLSWITGCSPEWPAVKARIRKQFPTVRHIGTEELAARLASTDAKKPLLLDVRTASEFEVSHLAGAQRIDPDAKGKFDELKLPKDAAIVTYCSVGYRSSAIAERLSKAGFTNVVNLEGSIFEWANEGRPLVSSQSGRVEKVHPYNEMWGKLLQPERRAALPPKK